MPDRGDELLTSTLTLSEVLVKPSETGTARLRSTYEDVRRDRSIRPPDAIQLACAAHARIDLFITNDDRLATKAIAGIRFIQSLDRAFL